MSRPSDFIDTYHSEDRERSQVVEGRELVSSKAVGASGGGGRRSSGGPKLGFVGWLRWGWRQLTSMKTALILLLLLALAAIPGSVFPQRSADPNGVVLYYERDPEGAALLDFFQLFDVFSSVWFASIYVLLFVSLIGCILPRTKHHFQALTNPPPKAPGRLGRLPGFTSVDLNAAELGVVGADLADREFSSALEQLRRGRFRVNVSPVRGGRAVTGERGYWRESGNLLFHISLVGVLVTVGLGGAFGYTGQRLLVTDQTFANTLSAYDSFIPGRLFSDEALPPYRLTMNDLDVYYEEDDHRSFGLAFNFTAHVTVEERGKAPVDEIIKVNHPLRVQGNDIFLLGNGYAPTLTVRNPEGEIVWQDSVPFLAQDSLYTSVGVVKIPDGLEKQIGMQGFFYPTQTVREDGAYASAFPDLRNPVLTLNVYEGDLGLDLGLPRSVYVLDTNELTQIAGRGTDVPGIELRVGETQEIPGGYGTISLDAIPRFASFDIHNNPWNGWILFFALTATAGLFLGLLVPRRRIWVKVSEVDGVVSVEYAGIARGEDPNLEKFIRNFVEKHSLLRESGSRVEAND